MRIHVLQHVPFEGPGCIGPWARRRGLRMSRSHLFAGDPLPDTDRFDLLIVLGGPMGVHDTHAHTWLTEEKRFIERALRKGKKILGICLGAQLIADVLGARVYPNPHREIGWHPVRRIPAGSGSTAAAWFPDVLTPFHWHGDTFALPAGALHLAESDACRHQAFFHPPAVLGLQFHLESTRASIAALIRHCGHELIPGPYIQSEKELRRWERIAPSNSTMIEILDYFNSPDGVRAERNRS